jgi:GTPase SAR1 family protein
MGETRFSLYNDIQSRTNGEIYIGVVGPVRTGKSTFIKQFMEQMVLPNIKEENALRRTVDELPQSAQGRTIMTTEPPEPCVHRMADSRFPVVWVSPSAVRRTIPWSLTTNFSPEQTVRFMMSSAAARIITRLIHKYKPHPIY